MLRGIEIAVLPPVPGAVRHGPSLASLRLLPRRGELSGPGSAKSDSLIQGPRLQVDHRVARLAAGEQQVRITVSIEIDDLQVVPFLRVRGVNVMRRESSATEILPPTHDLLRKGASDRVEVPVSIQIRHIECMDITQLRVDDMLRPQRRLIPKDSDAMSGAAHHV